MSGAFCVAHEVPSFMRRWAFPSIAIIAEPSSRSRVRSAVLSDALDRCGGSGASPEMKERRGTEA
jgi:hypothetical protein